MLLSSAKETEILNCGNKTQWSNEAAFPRFCRIRSSCWTSRRDSAGFRSFCQLLFMQQLLSMQQLLFMQELLLMQQFLSYKELL